MNGVWRSLLWKEWREQRFKLLAITLFTATIVLWPLLFDKNGTLPGAFMAIGFLCILSLGLFVGAALASSEQSQRTVGFLQSLPYSTRRIALAKLVVAVLTVAAPGVAMFGVISVWESLGYIQGNFGLPPIAFIVFAWSAYSFAIWVAAIAVNLADEVRAGAVGLLAIALFWGAFAVFADWFSPANERLLQGVAAAAPGGPLVVFIEIVDGPQRVAAGYSSQIIWHLMLLAGVSTLGAAVVYVHRFHRVAVPRRQQFESAAKSIVPGWLAPPMRKPWSAILWKQCCESLPLALLGAGSIFCLTLTAYLANRRYQTGVVANSLLTMSIPIWIMLGGLVSIVSGIGLWLDDLRPQLHIFWRSRAIATGQWFTLKFAAGAVLTLATLAMPSLLLYGIAAVFEGRTLQHLFGEDNWRIPVSLAILSQLGFFCVAAAFMAATRRPMVSALLTIFFAAGVVFCVMGPLSLEYAGIVVVIAAISAIATAAGWFCIRHDWAVGQ